jgi:hypothetical protein
MKIQATVGKRLEHGFEHTLGHAFEHRMTGLAARVLLVPVFVAVCHLYDWAWLRVLTTVTLVRISALLGVPMHSMGPDAIRVAGISAQFVVACTMIDAFFGAIPLLWRTTFSWSQNILRLSVVLLAVFGLNIGRLELGFIAMTKGAPWWLAHEVVAGVAYFCLYLYIVKERAWDHTKNGPACRRFIPGTVDPVLDS